MNYLPSVDRHHLKKGKYSAVDVKEKVKVMMNHLDSMTDYYGERKGIFSFRTQMFKYIKNYSNSATIRRKLQTLESISEIKSGISAGSFCKSPSMVTI